MNAWGISRLVLGKPPARFIVLEYEDARWEEAKCDGEEVAAWVVDGLGLRDAPMSISHLGSGAWRRSYFENALVRFYISPAQRRAVLEFTLGPLYGHGTSYEIAETDDGHSLEFRRDTCAEWIS